MKKIIKWIKELNYRVYILAGAVVGSLLLTVLRYKLSFRRAAAGVSDLISSARYYFAEMFCEENNVAATVTQLPDITLEELIPWNWNEILRKLREMWGALFTKEMFLSWFLRVTDLLHDISFYLMLFVPVVIGFFVIAKMLIMTPNNIVGEDTKALKTFKKVFRKPFVAVRKWLKEFFKYALENKLTKVLLWIWLFNLNILSIVIEFAAYYVYFASAFDFGNLLIQVAKLLCDLIIMFGGLPLVVWLIIGVRVFDVWRQSVGYNVLEHNEMKNRGFINSLPIMSLVCSSMGGGKTTLITDMALSQEIMFRDHVFDDLCKTDLKLPNFPWRKFEWCIRAAIKDGQIFNLASAEAFVEKKRRRFEKAPSDEKLYDYSLETYALQHSDDLTVSGLFDIMTDYCKLYFMYVVWSSWIISNYSIRTDNVLNDSGNFPLWQSELFRKTPELSASVSRHSHILDFDVLRLGQKVIENNKNAGSFEFGVVNISEIGKERKNNLELTGTKKDEESANQKNDYFNLMLKMIRHPGCVNKYCYVKVFSDEQRPESLGADARDLCTVIDIMSKSELVITMPGFLFGDLLHDLFFEKCKKFYYDVRYVRGDNTLLMYLFKNIFAALNHHYVSIYNRFGMFTLNVGIRKGTLDKDAGVEMQKYYIATKKDFADKFSTDCYSGYFKPQAQASKIGLFGYPEYSDVCATKEELDSQNSYFIRELESKVFKPQR